MGVYVEFNCSSQNEILIDSFISSCGDFSLIFLIIGETYEEWSICKCSLATNNAVYEKINADIYSMRDKR